MAGDLPPGLGFLAFEIRCWPRGALVTLERPEPWFDATAAWELLHSHLAELSPDATPPVPLPAREVITVQAAQPVWMEILSVPAGDGAARLTVSMRDHAPASVTLRWG